MIGRPAISQSAETRRPSEDCPPRTASKRFGHSHKLGTPSGQTAEIALQGFSHFGTWFEKAAGRIVTVAAKRLEIDFVQSYRTRGDQLFTLESVDLERRCATPIQGRKTCAYRVQPA